MDQKNINKKPTTLGANVMCERKILSVSLVTEVHE